MSQRLYRVGSIYGSRWFNSKIARRYGLPEEKRIKHVQWPIVSGDTVQVISGPEKGKVGEVLFVKRKTNELVVKDVNIHVRTKKASPVRGGFFYKTESPIHYTNVQLVDPITQLPCKVKFAKDLAGTNIRYSTASGAVIPKPKREFPKVDRSKKMNKVLDTKPEDVWAVTFKPFQKGFNPSWEWGWRSPKQAAYDAAEAQLKKFKQSQVFQPIAHI